MTVGRSGEEGAAPHAGKRLLMDVLATELVPMGPDTADITDPRTHDEQDR